MKPQSRHLRAWMEWRNPHRTWIDYMRVLERELAAHMARDLGPLRTFEDAARVRKEGEASQAAAVARAREHLAAVRQKVRRRLRRARQ